MNYIITGGTGFIGTHLTNLIKKRYPDAQIYNLDIVKPGTPNPVVKDYKSALQDDQELQSTFIEYDIRMPIENLPFTPTENDVIFNFAAVHRTPGHEAHEYFETNIRGAENVCTFAEKFGIKQIVFTSSIAPYGAAEEEKKESSLPTPNTPYGISKLVAEKIHETWQQAEKGRKLTILRPGVVFGKGENGNFTRLFDGIKKRRFAYPGRKDTLKASIYVKELVHFILWNVEKRNTNYELYNCIFSPIYSIQRIVETIKNVTGIKSYIPFIPNAIIAPIAKFFQLIGSPMGICPDRVKKIQISTNINGGKMAESGYVFKWSFEEAIEDWYKDNKNKCLH